MSHFIKKPNTLFVLLTISFVLAVSCKEQHPVMDAFLNIPSDIVENKSVDKYESLVEGIEYIPLETSPNSMLSEPVQLVVTSYGYTVLDDRRAVKHFDKDGKFLFDVGRLGRGPGEYSAPVSICYDNDCFYVLDQVYLYKYSAANGKFLEKYQMPRYCTQAVVRGDYIYCVDLASEDYDIIYSTEFSNLDKADNIFAGYKNRHIDEDSSFSPLLISGEDVLFCNQYLGRIYQIKDGNLELLLNYDFAEKAIPEKLLKNGSDLRTLTDMVSDFGNAFIAGDYIIFEYSFLSSTNTCISCVNLTDNKMMEYSSFWYGIWDSHVYARYDHNLCSDKEFVYRLSSPSNYSIECDSIPSAFQTFQKIINLTGDDNYYIVKTKLARF